MPEDGLRELTRQRDYLSARLEDAARERTRMDMLNLSLTHQRRQARAAFDFIRSAHEKAAAAPTIDILFRRVVETIAADLGTDSAAVVRCHTESGTLEVLASVGLPGGFPSSGLDEGISRADVLIPMFANAETVPNPFQECVRRALSFPFFVWCPFADEEDGILALLVGNRTEDMMLRQAFSDRTLDTIGALASVVQLRRDCIAAAENELTQREQRIRFLAEILRTSPISVIATDDRARIIYVSPAAERLFGYAAEELIGKDPGILNAEPNAEEIQRQIVGTISDGGVWTGELLNRRRNGELFYIRAAMYQLLDDDGRVLSLVGFQEDITDKRQAEEQLLRAQKLESLGVLAGGIAHDFNNILTSILGNISLAQSGSQSGGSAAANLAQAEEACVRATDLTQQLLTFSRGGAPVRTTMYVRGLIGASANLALRGGDITCDYRLAADLWPVSADEGQIAQVISNLVINAKQAIPKDKAIRIRADNVVITPDSGLPLSDGRYVAIAVTDRGMGIPAEHLDRIFDPYFTTKQDGSGLGLATAHSIIRQHDGFIAAESEIGAGTTICVYLPASEEAVPVADIGDGPRLAVEGRILLMDDEDAVRKPTAQMLARLGCQAEMARDGAEAVELYRGAMAEGRRFDAVILDLTVPGAMGGQECIRELLEIDPECRAIVSSGYSSDPVMSRFGEYGFGGVLAKPFTLTDLNSALHSVIGSGV